MRYQYAYFQPENIKSDQTKVQVAQIVSVYSNKSLSKFHLVAKIMELTVSTKTAIEHLSSDIPTKCPGGLFQRGCLSNIFHRDQPFFTGVQCKEYFFRSLKMAGDAKLLTGDPRWINFLLGLSPLAYFFTGVEAGGALGRDVRMERKHKITRQAPV